ncbi:hypothetical protein E2C01_070109 [Portunus trituberculatus]|uniref:Uncharacterized protein n=1 Tax=Portunus trituberculatus TaxID=210409 RepID=A0A5B7I191_PORTR|nr:hypothetical protein [Portunus trituberculatus]
MKGEHQCTISTPCHPTPRHATQRHPLNTARPRRQNELEVKHQSENSKAIVWSGTLAEGQAVISIRSVTSRQLSLKFSAPSEPSFSSD